MRHKLVFTDDGSASIEDTQLNAGFHSARGAMTESLYVYLENGFHYLLKQKAFKSLKIIEMGFGSGLNAALTMKASRSYPNLEIRYLSLEAFPIEQQTAEAFLTGMKKTNAEISELNQKLLEVAWNKSFHFDSFTFEKRHVKWEAFETDKTFDLFYYDAFSPYVQPELWDEASVKKMQQLLKPGGVLATFCVQSKFRRLLVDFNFEVEKLPGPPGKREVLRAIRR